MENFCIEVDFHAVVGGGIMDIHCISINCISINHFHGAHLSTYLLQHIHGSILKTILNVFHRTSEKIF